MNASVGQWMDQVTRSWLIYQMTDSATQLGLVNAVRGLPFLFFGMIAGVYADRSGRKAQLVWAQATNVALNLILGVLVATGQVHPWHVYVTGFLAGAVQAFQQPARQTLISDLVKRDQLMNALALNSAALQLARSVGPTIAGLLIASVGIHGSYFVQAVLFALATQWTLQMRVPERSAENIRSGQDPFVQSLREGAGFIFGHHHIRALMLLALGSFVLAWPYSSLMPVFARDILNGDARLQGVLFTTIGLGALGGALLVASLPRDGGRAWMVCLGAGGLGLAVMGFGLSSWLPLTLVMCVLIGIAGTAYQTQAQTMIQITTPSRLRGRVMGVYLLNVGLNPIGSSVIGVLAELFGAPAAVTVMSGASIVLTALVTVFTPGLWRMRVEPAERQE